MSVDKDSEIVQEGDVETVEIETTIADKIEPKISTHSLAVSKIEQAKYKSQNTLDMIEECMKNIDLDMGELNREKTKLFAEVIDPIEVILTDLDVDGVVQEEVVDSSVELKELDDAKVEIKDLSRGRAKGLFFAVISAIALLVGWCYMATTALGMSFVPPNGPDIERLNKALEWTATQLGQTANANIGAAVLIIVLLIVAFLIYSLIVYVRAANNLKTAQSIESKVEAYCTNKEECREKMAVVREHIQSSSKIADKYRVILDELYAKLKRAVYIEEHDSYRDLHSRTKADILTMQKLIIEIKALLNTPIADHGVLTDGVIQRVDTAKNTIDEYIKKLYV